MVPPPVPAPESAPAPLGPLDEVIDLVTGRTAGWMLERRAGPATAGVWAALGPHRRHDGGGFLGVMLSGRDVGHLSRRLEAAARLDGLALLVHGPMDREGLTLLERARERGALVGCDSSTALVRFAALFPDLLAVSARELRPVLGDASGAAVVRTLAGIAGGVGARVLARHVTSPEEMGTLRELGVALAQAGVRGSSPPVGRPPHVTTASFGRVKRSWKHPLEQRSPSLVATGSTAALVDLCLEHADHDWIVLVDERSRPVRLIERAALLGGEPFEHRPVRVSPSMPLRGVAQAAADRPEGDRSRPLVLCDHAGRYRGLLLLDRRPSRLAACS